MPKRRYVSPAVIRRLPRYHRFLGRLIENGVERISSKELSSMMNLTASQIRQDFNCFGEFGQQGYGYETKRLHNEIGEIMGLDRGFTAVLIGAGNLGKAFAKHIDFNAAGFTLEAVFDNSPEQIGMQISGLVIRDVSALEEFCSSRKIDTGILCLPGEAAAAMVTRMMSCGIKSFWNFTHEDISLISPDIIVENVHLTDGLMVLCYQLNDALKG